MQDRSSQLQITDTASLPLSAHLKLSHSFPGPQASGLCRVEQRPPPTLPP